MLLGRHDEISLSDFGITLVAQSSRSQSAQGVAGTMAYMSPEQIQGKPRPQSDQYSLGIVVYEWLTGDHPFHGGCAELVGQHLSATPPSLQEKVSTIPPEVNQIVQTALTKDPKQRFESVKAFASALRDAAQHAPGTAIVSTPTINLPMEAATLPAEPVVQALSSEQPEGLEPSLTEIKSAQLEPATQTTDTVISPQTSALAPYAPSQNPHLTFPQSKRQRIVLALILLSLMLVGAGSLGSYTATVGKGTGNTSHNQPISHTLNEDHQSTVTAQASTIATTQASATSTTQANNAAATATAQVNASATAQANASATAQTIANTLGKTWISRPSGTGQNLVAIAWSGSQFVAAGNGSTILTSPDGINWTSRTAGTSQALYGIGWFSSRLVAVGNGGTILTCHRVTLLNSMPRLEA